CVSDATEVTINAAPDVPEAPEVTVTQPTCAEPTGTITITSPLGANLEYSIDGVNYQSGVVFSGLGAGTYQVTVRDINDTTCVSDATEVTINTAPDVPEAPEVTVTQPTCAEPTGTITITSPLGANLEYSIDGVNYQSGVVFSGLGASTYQVTVRDINDTTCVSDATEVTINTAPDVPEAPEVTVTQPTCAEPTGTITNTSPLGANLEYSIDGVNYQSGVVFSGLGAGTYQVTVRDINDTTCVSAQTEVTINAAPDIPVAPTVTVTQPTCADPTGTITVTAPLG